MKKQEDEIVFEDVFDKINNYVSKLRPLFFVGEKIKIEGKEGDFKVKTIGRRFIVVEPLSGTKIVKNKNR